MKPRQRSAGIATLVAVMVLAASPTAAVAPSQVGAGTVGAAADCADVQFFGLKGSGQGGEGGSTAVQMGPEVGSTFTFFTEEMADKGLLVTGTPIRYHAPPVSIESLKDAEKNATAGALALRGALNEAAATDCDDLEFVLSGYSLGAYAVQLALDPGLTAEPALTKQARTRVKAVVLYASPMFDPSDPYAEGDFDPNLHGAAGRKRLPTLPHAATICLADDPVCNFTWDDTAWCRYQPDSRSCAHVRYHTHLATYATWLTGLFPAHEPPVSEPQAPLIVSTSTYQEGVLVYARANYTDVNGDAEGFGFSWQPGTESHPFSSPSYGRVSAGRVDYPFNLACGQPNQKAVDVQMWIYDKGGLKSQPATVHLTCQRGPGR
ncbi:cutinase family protein [Actinoplanes sp. NEAU-A12]|uniref:Cutinase family protein n=1 Tax=Actinoplanes sandaracinus TaxID=3045177 RepID=A0ABT6WZ47_9ACTN|nr:cutinase family protein [Actinoplanes sandaracinus]MDI6105032.1 cutinase family protein [Actinoplanes sandaracinus]